MRISEAAAATFAASAIPVTRPKVASKLLRLIDASSEE
jgi:hypothetical protein